VRGISSVFILRLEVAAGTYAEFLRRLTAGGRPAGFIHKMDAAGCTGVIDKSRWTWSSGGRKETRETAIVLEYYTVLLLAVGRDAHECPLRTRFVSVMNCML